MPRLYRPSIPDIVKVLVAGRQLLAVGVNVFAELSREEGETRHDLLERRLTRLAKVLGCPRNKLRLDHDPALENRMKRTVFKLWRGKLRKITIYSPDANDPRYLIYREDHAHHIKTNVRGEHGQFPDNTIAKRERRRLKKKTPPPNAKIAKTWNLHQCMSCGRVHAKGECRLKPKRKWPSRPFQNRRKKR